MTPPQKNHLQKIIRDKKLFQQESLMYQRLMEAMRGDVRLEDVYKLIITIVTQGLGFDRAGIFILQPDGKSVSLAMGIDNQGRYETGLVYPVEDRPDLDPFSSLLFGYKKYFLTNNAQKRQFARKKGWGRYDPVEQDPKRFLNNAVVPMVVGHGKIIGLLAVDNFFKPRFISKSDLAVLTNFATQAGIAVESFHLHEKIISLTITDQLTGAYNRRYFDHCLAGELNRSRRYGRPCGLLYLDLDHFKSINDRYGHAGGDAVLKQIAALLQGNLRQIDRLCRIGGEEFGILLPEVSREHCTDVAERLGGLIRQMVPQVDAMAGRKERVTASIGVSFTLSGEATPDQLMMLADKSLYQAKRAGRDRIGDLLTFNRA